MPSQGQPKGAGQAAGERFVSFSRGAAQRIAKVVRIVEGGNRDQGGLTFDHPMPQSGKVFRICTHSAAWNKGTVQTVTFKYQANTPNTVSATNLFANVPAAGDCAVAKEGTAWFLIAAECSASV